MTGKDRAGPGVATVGETGVSGGRQYDIRASLLNRVVGKFRSSEKSCDASKNRILSAAGFRVERGRTRR